MPDRDLADAMLEVARERMQAEGLSVNALAKRLGVPQPSLKRRLVDGEGNVAIDEWAEIAEAIGMTLDELIAAGRKRS